MGQTAGPEDSSIAADRIGQPLRGPASHRGQLETLEALQRLGIDHIIAQAAHCYVRLEQGIDKAILNLLIPSLSS